MASITSSDSDKDHNNWVQIFQVFRDIYDYRRLIHHLVMGNERSQYYRLSLGIVWRYLEPIIMIAVYFLFLSVIRPETPGTDHVLVIVSGLMVFDWFMRTVSTSSSAILTHESVLLTSNVPIAPFIACSVYHSAYSTAPLWLMGILYCLIQGIYPNIYWLGIIPVIGLCALLFFPMAIILAIVGVYVRDLSRLVLLLARMLLFVSPVLYEMIEAPARLQLLLSLNPLAPLIEGLRTALYREEWVSVGDMSSTIVLIFVLMPVSLVLLAKTGRGVVKSL